MTNILFFDIKTKGNVPKFNLPADRFPEYWPHLTQIEVLLYRLDEDCMMTLSDNIIHLDFDIKSKTEACKTCSGLSDFRQLCGQADLFVTYDYAFKYNVLTAAYARIRDKSPMMQPYYCLLKHADWTIASVTEGEGLSKNPTLHDFYFNLLKSSNKSVETPIYADLEIIARCYFELNRLGLSLAAC